MTADRHYRTLVWIIILILVVGATFALALMKIATRPMILVLPPREAAPAGPAAKPAEEMPAKRVKPDRSKISAGSALNSQLSALSFSFISTNAATAGECAPYELRKHRSANPASRGLSLALGSRLEAVGSEPSSLSLTAYRLIPSAPAAGFHQLAGLSLNSARFVIWPRESDTAIHSAQAPAGQLRNFAGDAPAALGDRLKAEGSELPNPYTSPLKLSTGGDGSAQPKESILSPLFRFPAPLGHPAAHARRARAHARQHSASQHRGISCFAAPAGALVGSHPCPSVQSVVGSTARQEGLPA